MQTKKSVLPIFGGLLYLLLSLIYFIRSIVSLADLFEWGSFGSFWTVYDYLLYPLGFVTGLLLVGILLLPRKKTAAGVGFLLLAIIQGIDLLEYGWAMISYRFFTITGLLIPLLYFCSSLMAAVLLFGAAKGGGIRKVWFIPVILFFTAYLINFVLSFRGLFSSTYSIFTEFLTTTEGAALLLACLWAGLKERAAIPAQGWQAPAQPQWQPPVQPQQTWQPPVQPVQPVQQPWQQPEQTWQAPAQEAPAPAVPAPEVPVQETPPAEAPVTEAPAVETPVAEAPAAEAAAQPEGAYDELAKMKKLLDDGLITQEDYDAKKRQILGL